LKVVVDTVVETENGYNGFSRLAAVNLDQGLETKALDTTVKVIKRDQYYFFTNKAPTCLI
jgi:hypothetical protein